jgi:hypothetical protein
MKLFLTQLIIAAVALPLLAGQAMAQSDQGGQPPDVMASSPGGAPQSNGDQLLPVLYVTSIEVLQTTLEPKQYIVKVRGLTGSIGWSDPQLVPLFEGQAADGILDLQFIGQTPEETEQAHGFVPITAVFPIEAEAPFKGIRVRAAANVVELKQIPGAAEVKVTAEDCAKCVGKTFAPKGTAAPGTPGVVREEDLPRNFRVIPPTKGVAGITHNMNRLNLILGDDDKTIVWAYWE